MNIAIIFLYSFSYVRMNIKKLKKIYYMIYIKLYKNRIKMEFKIVKIKKNTKPKDIKFRRFKKFLSPEDKDEYSTKLQEEAEISCINIIRKHLEEKGKYERIMKSLITNKFKDNICVLCLESLETIKIIVSDSWSKHCGCRPTTSLYCLDCMKRFLEYDKSERERIKRKRHIVCSDTFKLHEASYKVESDLMKILDETKPWQEINICDCVSVTGYEFRYTTRMELYEHIRTECELNHLF